MSIMFVGHLGELPLSSASMATSFASLASVCWCLKKKGSLRLLHSIKLIRLYVALLGSGIKNGIIDGWTIHFELEMIPSLEPEVVHAQKLLKHIKGKKKVGVVIQRAWKKNHESKNSKILKVFQIPSLHNLCNYTSSILIYFSSGEGIKPMKTPKDAMPWVGLYVAGASLACTPAMAADTFQGFQQRKLSFLILVSYCWYFRNHKTEENVSNSNVRSERKEYAKYVLQIEDDAKLSERISRNALKSINQLLSKSEKNEPGNLIKLLKKSTGFKGVLEFDNDQVPPLHSEETKNSWSLVVVTLTAIVVALPNTANDHGEGLIASMREGLHIVRNIEECLNADSDMVKTRRAARRVWTQVEVYRKWLQIDLQKKARDGKTSKEILEWLRDEAVKIVIQFKSCKRRTMDDSHYKFIVASSMYRVSQTILIHCSELENWPLDGQLLEWISNMIADILCACFTNLPCVIKKMCHHEAIEKREDSVRSAAQLLGRSRKILEILNTRQLPNLDVDSMADIGKWHALPKSEIPNDTPLNQIQPAFPSPNESVIVNIRV
ncbi:hypothetical protein Tco_1476620 [Tanacetum coccineum]